VATSGYIYVTKVVKPEEVAAASGCVQFMGFVGPLLGTALATLVYTNVADMNVQLQSGMISADGKKALLRGLRASYWFWAGLSFFGAFVCHTWLDPSDGATETLSSLLTIHRAHR
jgi:hypothetical protein